MKCVCLEIYATAGTLQSSACVCPSYVIVTGALRDNIQSDCLLKAIATISLCFITDKCLNNYLTLTMIYLFLFIIQIGCYELNFVSLRERKLPVGRDKRAEALTVQKDSNVHASVVIPLAAQCHMDKRGMSYSDLYIYAFHVMLQ